MSEKLLKENYNNKYISALDCYRGIAAICVTTIHININSIFLNSEFSTGLFVQLFFVLSGYVLYINYYNNLKKFADLKNFLKKRILRLYPLHLFFLIIFLLVEIAKFVAMHQFNIIPNRPVFEENNFYTFILNLILVQNFFGSPGSFNGPSWSISAEFFTYIIFALFLIYFKEKLEYILLAYILIFIILFSKYFNYDWGVHAWLSCLYCFSIGVISAKVFLIKKLNFNPYVINILFLLIFFLTFFFIENKKLGYYIPFLFGILFYFTSLLNSSGLIYRIIFNKFLIFLGKISYSIYLCHAFVYWSLTQFLRFILNWPIENSATGVGLKFSLVEGSFFIIIFIAITILVANFTYLFVEKKFYKKLK